MKIPIIGKIVEDKVLGNRVVYNPILIPITPISVNKRYKQNEITLLQNNYPNKGLKFCADFLKRKSSSIRCKVSSMGLKQNRNSLFFKDWQKRAGESKIGKKRPEQSLVIKKLWKEGKLKPMDSEKAKILFKDRWKTLPHPKGFLGKHHNENSKILMSTASKKMWSNPNFYGNSDKYKQEVSDRQTKIMANRIKTKGSVYSRSHNGWYKIGKRKFYFRSGWEIVFARYLEWLKSQNKIQKWEYEPDTFWFEKIKRGVRSYTPDFKVFYNNGGIEYYEIKGWMDNKSKTKLKRIKKYYPKIKLILIDKTIYKDILKFERMYPEANKITAEKKQSDTEGIKVEILPYVEN